MVSFRDCAIPVHAAVTTSLVNMAMRSQGVAVVQRQEVENDSVYYTAIQFTTRYVGNFDTKAEARPSVYAREWGRCLSSASPLAWWLDAICNSVQQVTKRK